MLLINKHTLTNKSSCPKAASATNKSAPYNFLEFVCSYRLMPKHFEPRQPDVRLHLDVCPNLLLPDPGAFIHGDPQKLLPDPGGPAQAKYL